MKRTITSIENTYFENYDVLGFCMGGSLTFLRDENKNNTLAERCFQNPAWSSDQDIFPITASFLDDSDQIKEEFIRWNRDNQSAEVIAYYPRRNGSTTVIRYNLTK